jgi:hypothetical protein
VKEEASLVKNTVCNAYVKYGMNVFEYEDTENQRIREEQSDEVVLGQTEGGSWKKDRTDPERQTMTSGVSSSGGAGDDEYGFSDDESHT